MLVDIVLPAILTIIMFSLGLGLGLADFTRVVREPKAFAIGAFNQVIILPIVGFAIAVGFGLPPAMAVGVMILALCPGGVMSNVATRLAGGAVPLSITLTAVISLVSIITLPLLTAWSVGYFMGADAPPVNVTALGVTMFLLTAVPVGLGMALTRAAPSFVATIAPWMNRITFILFVLLLVAALAANWATFMANIAVLGPALILMNGVLLVIGVITAKAGGLSVQDTTTVAIESGIQNGTLGIAVGAIVAGVASGIPETSLPTAIYSITLWALSLPFVIWRRSLT